MGHHYVSPEIHILPSLYGWPVFQCRFAPLILIVAWEPLISVGYIAILLDCIPSFVQPYLVYSWYILVYSWYIPVSLVPLFHHRNGLRVHGHMPIFLRPRHWAKLKAPKSRGPTWHRRRGSPFWVGRQPKIPKMCTSVGIEFAKNGIIIALNMWEEQYIQYIFTILQAPHAVGLHSGFQGYAKHIGVDGFAASQPNGIRSEMAFTFFWRDGCSIAEILV